MVVLYIRLCNNVYVNQLAHCSTDSGVGNTIVMRTHILLVTIVCTCVFARSSEMDVPLYFKTFRSRIFDVSHKTEIINAEGIDTFFVFSECITNIGFYFRFPLSL